MKNYPRRPEPDEVLYRIKRGLAGYVSYLAACEMNEAFSEYVLYEPILRILTAQGYKVESEVKCPNIEQPLDGGDYKKIDFEIQGHNLQFAMEVKWAKRRKLDIKGDYEKLAAYRLNSRYRRSFLCVFGVWSAIENLDLSNDNFKSHGELICVDFGRTKYGCRIYELV